MGGPPTDAASQPANERKFCVLRVSYIVRTRGAHQAPLPILIIATRVLSVIRVWARPLGLGHSRQGLRK